MPGKPPFGLTESLRERGQYRTAAAIHLAFRVLGYLWGVRSRRLALTAMSRARRAPCGARYRAVARTLASRWLSHRERSAGPRGDLPSGAAPARLYGRTEPDHRVPGCRGALRAPPRARRGAGRAQGRCARHGGDPGLAGGEEGDGHHSYRDGGCGRSRADRLGREPCAAGWQCHGQLKHRRRSRRQAARAGPGVASEGVASGGPVESRQRRVPEAGADGGQGGGGEAEAPAARSPRPGVPRSSIAPSRRSPASASMRVLVIGDPVFNAHASELAELAVKHRLPTVSSSREYVERGFLMTYGPSFADAHRLSAVYVDRILKGARPADLARGADHEVRAAHQRPHCPRARGVRPAGPGRARGSRDSGSGGARP